MPGRQFTTVAYARNIGTLARGLGESLRVSGTGALTPEAFGVTRLVISEDSAKADNLLLKGFADMAKQLTSTATVSDEKREPVGSDKESALRGGLTVSVKALASLWTAKELTAAEQRRAVMFVQMIRQSDPADVKEAMRGATKEEKEADENAQAPVVAAMVKGGMLESSARVRLSQMRTVYASYADGSLPVFNAKGDAILPDAKIPGWNPLVKAATEAAKQRKIAKANIRKTHAEREIIESLAAGKGGLTELSGEEFDAIKAKAAEVLQSQAIEQAAEKQGKKLTRTIESILEDGDGWAEAIMRGIAAKLGYTVARMSKQQRKEGKNADDLIAELRDSLPALAVKSETVEEVRH